MARKQVAPEKRREYTKRHIGKRKAADSAGYAEYRAKLNRDWIARNRERYNRAKSEYRFKLKLAAIEHYSRGKMCCALCGYSADLDALCLDHVNDDGAEQRRALGCTSRSGASGTTIYERLKAIGWMPGLQVLCANCNTIKELRRKRGNTAAEMLGVIQSGPIRWKKAA